MPPARTDGSRRADRLARLFAAATLASSVALAQALDTWNSDAPDDRSGKGEDVVAAEEALVTRGRPTPPTKEFMVGFYGGAPYTYDSPVTLKDGTKHDFTMRDASWRGEPFIDPIYYGVRVVKWLEGGRTGTMLDFTHSKALADKEVEVDIEGILNGDKVEGTRKLGDVFRRLEFSHGHNMLTVNGLFRLADITPRLSPYIGLGLGINLPHTEIQLMKGGRRTYEYQYAGPVVQALVGVEFRVPRLSYFLEYKFSLAQYDVPLSELDGTKIGLFADLYRQVSNMISGEEPPGGRLQTRLTSHQVIGGLGVRFGAAPAPLDGAPAP